MLKITHFHLEKNKNSYCKIFNSLYFPFDSTQNQIIYYCGFITGRILQSNSAFSGSSVKVLVTVNPAIFPSSSWLVASSLYKE